MTQHIEKRRVVERLNEAIGYPAGNDHEVRALSAYAGYDLMPTEADSVCEAE